MPPSTGLLAFRGRTPSIHRSPSRKDGHRRHRIGRSRCSWYHAQCLERRAYDQLGSPEGELALAQATLYLYLALAPKSNAIYTAFSEATELAKKTTQHDPPKIILNAPTKMMKDLEYGKGYKYDS